MSTPVNSTRVGEGHTCSYPTLSRGQGASMRVPIVSSSVKLEGEPSATDQHLSRTNAAQKPFIRSPSSTASRGGGKKGYFLPTKLLVEDDVWELLILLSPPLRTSEAAALAWYLPSRNRPFRKK